MSFAELFPGSTAEFDGEFYDSQTEATWAAYLDLHGVVFEHEPATYKLPAGQVYTPDFYLSEMDAFVEVKNGNADNRAAYVMSLLTYATGKQGFIVNGKPHYATVYAYTPEWTFKPSKVSELPHDQKLTYSTPASGNNENTWLPDEEADEKLRLFAFEAARRANERSSRMPTDMMAVEHTEKKKRMRLPENIIDLTNVSMPAGSIYSFPAEY